MRFKTVAAVATTVAMMNVTLFTVNDVKSANIEANFASANVAPIVWIESETLVEALYMKKYNGQYKFVYKDGANRKARWNSCEPINWKYNPNRQRSSGQADVKNTVNTVKKKTSLPFKYKGKTQQRVKAADPKKVDMLIGWANGNDPIYDQVSGSPAGVTYIEYKWAVKYNPETGKTTNGAPEIVWASMALNPKKIPNRVLQKVVFLHELGHAVGLGHVNSKKEIMYATASASSKPILGLGDKKGMKKLGSGGCFPNSLR